RGLTRNRLRTGGSSVESGFHLGTLRFRSRYLTLRSRP
ncbi:hypothetical protein AVEN_178473-1, partial [Araneus ventricosus]